MTTTYTPIRDAVEMTGIGGPIRLDFEACDALLGIYLNAGAARDFNALHTALVAAGGIPWRDKPLAERVAA